MIDLIQARKSALRSEPYVCGTCDEIGCEKEDVFYDKEKYKGVINFVFDKFEKEQLENLAYLQLANEEIARLKETNAN